MKAADDLTGWQRLDMGGDAPYPDYDAEPITFVIINDHVYGGSLLRESSEYHAASLALMDANAETIERFAVPFLLPPRPVRRGWRGLWDRIVCAFCARRWPWEIAR